MSEENVEQTEKMRLAKYLASAGIASRRQCEVLIADGHVTVNGEAVTTPAFDVDPSQDEVRYDGKLVSEMVPDKVYLMLNKPAGYTCSAADEHAKSLVYELVPEKFGRVFTIGRLDRDSEGLLILTNDGDYAQEVGHPSRKVCKRYYVECDGQFTTAIRRSLMEGMYDNDEFLHALNVEEVSVQRGFCKLIFTLGEGRKREVRRLCKDVGLEVRLLRRISIGKLELDPKLPVGCWRRLTEEELKLAAESPELPETTTVAHPEDTRPYWQKNDVHHVRRERAPKDDARRGGAKPRAPRKEHFGAPAKPKEWWERDTDAAGERYAYGEQDERPRRDYGDREGGYRPRRDYGDRDERPKQNYGDREGGYRPRRDYGDREGGYRPRRDYGDRDERPRRDYGDRDERPRRDDGDRGPSSRGGEGNGRPGNGMRFTRGHKYPRDWR